MRLNWKRILLVLLIVVLAVGGFIFNKYESKLRKAYLPGPVRIKIARIQKGAAVKKAFSRAGVEYPPEELYFRVFKNKLDEGTKPQLEMWARGSDDSKFKLVKTYPVCNASGGIGPKRIEGDRQVPEGFYTIDAFNPLSSKFLSLKVSYPNASDRILSDPKRPGSNIFIHGGCASIGCLAITHDYVKEVYITALDTWNNSGQLIRIHIFPIEMSTENMKRLEKAAAGKSELLSFWKNLKQGYDIFEQNHRPPEVTADEKGAYHFEER